MGTGYILKIHQTIMIHGIGRKSADTCIQACIFIAALWVAAGCRNDATLPIPDLSQAGIETG